MKIKEFPVENVNLIQISNSVQISQKSYNFHGKCNYTNVYLTYVTDIEAMYSI